MAPAQRARTTRVSLLLWSCGLVMAVLQAASLMAGPGGVEPPEEPPPPAAARNDLPDPLAIRAALQRAVKLVEHSTRVYREHRKCFSCHHQALPVLALTAARETGLAVDQDNYQQQVQWTIAHLMAGREAYLKGTGQGGKADTAGYALWTLQAAGWQPDETTAAVVEFLLQWSAETDYWRTASHRPPSEASHFTTTWLAINGLEQFAAGPQRERASKRITRARQWLLQTRPSDTEDHVFRLRALIHLDAPDAVIDQAVAELLGQQREDGGWSQTPAMGSDAYATGSVLSVLLLSGRVDPASPAARRAAAWLLRTQCPDGSWHVPSRSRPFQLYFESGFPHGKDQFISITATCWAIMGLLPFLTPAG